MSNIIEGITKDLKEIPKNLKAKAGGMDTKKLVLLNFRSICTAYVISVFFLCRSIFKWQRDSYYWVSVILQNFRYILMTEGRDFLAEK